MPIMRTCLDDGVVCCEIARWFFRLEALIQTFNVRDAFGFFPFRFHNAAFALFVMFDIFLFYLFFFYCPRLIKIKNMF